MGDKPINNFRHPLNFTLRPLPLGAKVLITGGRLPHCHELADGVRAEVLRRVPCAKVFVSDSIEDDGRSRVARLHVIAYVPAVSLGVRENGSAHVEAIKTVQRAVETACRVWRDRPLAASA